MDRDQARRQIKGNLRDYVERITEKSKGANMYVCPLCGSGSGPNGTGAFSIKDGTSWKCFSCDQGGDIFDLIGAREGITDTAEIFKRAYEIYGLEVEGYTHNTHTTQKIHKPPKAAEVFKAASDLAAYFDESHKRISETDYPQQRGLSEAVIERFNLGYDPHFKTGELNEDKEQIQVSWKALIIPTGEGSCVARNTAAGAADGKRYRKRGESQLLNLGALSTDRPVFVVEGELDALSVIEAGGEAVALGSVANRRKLIEHLKQSKPPEAGLIIALDNDEQGEQAAQELLKELEALHIPAYKVNIAGECKDANEALLANRAGLIAAIKEAEQIPAALKEAEKELYLSTSAASRLQDFINGIAASVNTPYIPTGFKKLDGILDGGLYEGLYIVGAITSLGKTTLILQVADSIAQQGHDVLVFSLEMARYELMAKSMSRHTLIDCLDSGQRVNDAKTSRGITTGKKYANYSHDEKALIQRAVEAYSKYAQRIFISEGIGDIGVDQIRETVERHISITGNTPVVVIDYLQILAPYSDRATDKQNTDKAVLELKRISRDYKLPVIGISSFNRQNYSVAVAMEAFKESGAIEYSSDVLIGLQLAGAGKKDFDASEEKKKNPRNVELIILKNRNGRTGDLIPFEYYPLFNYFREC
jgi:replicative DNA helicase